MRDPVPQATATKLMVANKHTCCFCNKQGHIQIHHIDGNNSNNSIKNLAVLCLNCHSRVSSDEGLGRKFTVEEVKEYKAQWEKRCAGSDEDSEAKNQSNEDEITTGTITLERETTVFREYSLDKGDIIAVWVNAEKTLSVYIVEADEADAYIEDDSDDFELEYLKRAENKDEIMLEYKVKADGDYTILFVNDSKRTFDIEIDIQIWE